MSSCLRGIFINISCPQYTQENVSKCFPWCPPNEWYFWGKISPQLVKIWTEWILLVWNVFLQQKNVTSMRSINLKKKKKNTQKILQVNCRKRKKACDLDFLSQEVSWDKMETVHDSDLCMHRGILYIGCDHFHPCLYVHGVVWHLCSTKAAPTHVCRIINELWRFHV